VTVAVPTGHLTAQGAPLKSARERMDIIAAYREVGSLRAAAAMCGTTDKTVKRAIARHEAGGDARPPRPRERNYDDEGSDGPNGSRRHAAALIYQHATGEADRLIADRLSDLVDQRTGSGPDDDGGVAGARPVG
jgi:Homeodomain-like domain-containing protein